MSGYWTWASVEDLAAHRVVEGPSLEFKRELDLASRSSRIEALKDLSGLGNGGGGSVVYGMDQEEDGAASQVTPMGDRSVVGILEDTARSGIRPPLLARFHVVDEPDSDRFVLVVDVQRSPLGPYMVEAYEQRRYFIRQGSRTAPMSEQQVRDAYAIAGRAREHRAQVWASHALPFDPGTTAAPWLAVSALPEEPLEDVFDPADYGMETFQPIQELMTRFRPYIDSAGIEGATNRLRIWADGIAGDDSYDGRPPKSVMRLHRKGAALVATELHDIISTWAVPRALNGQLAYLGHVWQKIGLRGPVELDARLVNLTSARVQSLDWALAGEERPAVQPFAGPSPTIALRTEILPSELLAARLRHRIVQQFAHRLEQAFGRRRAFWMFDAGKLYGRSGSVGLAYMGGGIWWNEQGNQAAFVDDAGAITNDSGDVVAYIVDGVVLDLEGRALAACELATGDGLPDNYAADGVIRDPRARVASRDPGTPTPATHSVARPDPLREWSTTDPGSLIRT